jgi:sugar/nucleoside kinase (ribokinase family)
MVVVVGCAARDIVADDPRGWRLGGGVTYGGLTLARLGLPTKVLVGVDALAAEAHELAALRDAGAEVRLIHLDRTPVFENIEAPDGRIQTCLEPGDPLPVEALPDEWRSAGAWMLGPVADELPDAWAAVPAPDALVAFGWQGILRHLPRGGRVRKRPPAPSPLLRRADIVGVSRHDVDPSTPLEQLWHLLSPEATLLVTEGYLGGWEIRLDRGEPAGRRQYPAIPASAEVDPTGAGDVFLAAYLAAQVHHPLEARGRHGADLRLAAAAASLNVEGPGLSGVPVLAAVTRRVAATLHEPADG